jgi:hypothetical protein
VHPHIKAACSQQMSLPLLKEDREKTKAKGRKLRLEKGFCLSLQL